MEVYDDDDFLPDADELDDDYLQDYRQWATDFSKGLAASGESASGWFYADSVDEPSGEPANDWIDDLFYESWVEDYDDGLLESQSSKSY